MIPRPQPQAAPGRRRAGGPTGWRPWPVALLLAAGLLAGGPVRSQPTVPAAPAGAIPSPRADGAPTPITLAESVSLGLRGNRAIRSAYVERVAEKFDLLTAGRRFRPRLDVSASILAGRQGGHDVLSSILTPSASVLLPSGATVQFAWAHTTSQVEAARSADDLASLSIAQPLMRGFGGEVNAAPLRLARLQDEIDRLALKDTVAATTSEIILAYRALIQAQEQVRLSDVGLTRSRELLDTNRALIGAGRMAAADLVQTEADVAGQEVAVIEAGRQRESARLALARLLGLDLHVDLQASDALQAQEVVVDLGRAIELARGNRADYLSRRRAVEQARINLRLAKDARRWDLSAVGLVEHQGASGPAVLAEPSRGLSGAVGLKLSIPLGDPTLEQAEVRAKANLGVAELQLEDAGQQVEAQVRDAAAEVAASWRQLAASARARDLAVSALDIERAKFRAGRTSNFQVIALEGALRAAESRELLGKIAYLNALTTLDQQLGSTLDTWRISLND